MHNFSDLEFDLPSALLEQLVQLFERMPYGALESSSIVDIPDAQGVYQLFFRGSLVYVGKTDSDAGLRARLTRHARKIRSRLNLDPEDVSFKAVRVYVFTAMDLEALLLNHYREKKIKLEWNLSGFGSNDPGRNRDMTELKSKHFDQKYPIDLNLQIKIEEGYVSVADVLAQLKEKLAFTIRFQNAGGKSKRPHKDLVTTHCKLIKSVDSVQSILLQVARALGFDWQVTALPGYVVIYKEDRVYPHGQVIR